MPLRAEPYLFFLEPERTSAVPPLGVSLIGGREHLVGFNKAMKRGGIEIYL
jgi:hypothetical protein